MEEGSVSMGMVGLKSYPLLNYSTVTVCFSKGVKSKKSYIIDEFDFLKIPREVKDKF
jgi:hypothetical protein